MITRFVIIEHFRFDERKQTLNYPFGHRKFLTAECAVAFLKNSNDVGLVTNFHICPVTYSCIEELNAVDTLLDKGESSDKIDAMYDKSLKYTERNGING